MGNDQPAGSREKPLRLVLDASAVAALLFAEPGAEMVADAVAAGATVSTVNIGEVAKLLVERGLSPHDVLIPVFGQVEVESFTTDDALQAAMFFPQTAHLGLSFGDRACLALAKRLAAVAVTAEHAWAKVELGVEVQLIREFHARKYVTGRSVDREGRSADDE